VPTDKIEYPQGRDVPWQDKQYRFDGSWMPDADGALIGASNYQKLENLRYKESGLEGVNGYTKINTTALVTYTRPTIGHQLRTDKTIDSYIMLHAINGSDQGRVYVNTTTPGTQGDFDSSRKLDTSGNAYFEDASASLTGRFSDAPQGNIAYCNGEESVIFGGDEQRLGAVFTTATNTLNLPIDVTEKANNTLSDADNVFNIDIAGAGPNVILALTTRPIQAIGFEISSANVSASSTTVKTWTGSAFGADLVDVDGTKTGGVSMAQDGVITFSSHTDGTSKPMHFEELYLYAYMIELSTGDVDISRLFVDMAMQSVKDVWDGVYRQPIQFQVNYDNEFFDYTLQVNESSDVNAPIGGQLDALDTTDAIYIMFEDKAAGIRFTMLGDKLNSTSSNPIVMKYWDGSAFSAVTDLTDGTEAASNTPFSQSGLMSWTPEDDEEPRTMFGSFGYVYELIPGAKFSGTKGGVGTDVDILVDVCTGVPSQNTVLPFDWSALYGTRLVLGGYSTGDEGNRLDYSVANAPDVWNGFDSSDNGKQSLYFGGVEPIVAATQIYNRFGATVYSMLLVLKKNEVYIVVGDTPEEFVIYPVVKTVGCIAPLTLATAEIGLDLGNGLTRNVAMWLSHSGPMMFDGAILTPIKGVSSYFDPNDDRYIEFSAIDKARGWVDPSYKEYNLLIPSGSGATDNTVWLVYDLERRKWFTKNTQLAKTPTCGFEVSNVDTGERMIYGGIDSGFMLHLENGTLWGDGGVNGITQIVRTGDIFPSENIWDETLIRKMKIFTERLIGSSVTNTMTIRTYVNTELKAGNNVIFQDSNAALNIEVDWEDTTDVEWAEEIGTTVTLDLDVGLQRLIRSVRTYNQQGWSHSFEFEVTTTDVTKGFQPVLWGFQYRLVRKDNTANG
jgi:hypothetical protein